MLKTLVFQADVGFRQILATAFVAQGHDVMIAGDWEDALVIAAEWQPDSIVLELAPSDGVGLARLRAAAGPKTTRLVALVADDSDPSYSHAVPELDQVLVKNSVTFAEILAAIEPKALCAR